IQIQEEATLFWVNSPAGKWTTLASAVTCRFFDFDHLGAEIGHELGRIRRRYHVSQLKYLHSFQSLHVVSLLFRYCPASLRAVLFHLPFTSFTPLSARERRLRLPGDYEGMDLGEEKLARSCLLCRASLSWTSRKMIKNKTR